MSENNLTNLSLKNPFGLNVALPKRTLQQVKKVVKQEVANLSVNPFLDFLESSEDVFTGKTASKIQKYQAQIYSLGQLMREGQPEVTFDVKV